MASGEDWSEDEKQAMMLYYPEHGGKWEGWKDLLPGRTLYSIYTHARRYGLTNSREKPPKRVRVRRAGVTISVKDPYEDYILACMAGGMTPSQVDSKMKWTPGKARLILSERWLRLKNQYKGA